MAAARARKERRVSIWTSPVRNSALSGSWHRRPRFIPPLRHVTASERPVRGPDQSADQSKMSSSTSNASSKTSRRRPLRGLRRLRLRGSWRSSCQPWAPRRHGGRVCAGCACRARIPVGLEPFHLVKRRAAGPAGQFMPATRRELQHLAAAAIGTGGDLGLVGHRRSPAQSGLNAYRLTAAALETLSDPKAPAAGMRAKTSHNSRVRARRPGPSAPRTSAGGPPARLPQPWRCRWAPLRRGR
jgi:hypothetical protein